MSLTSLTYLVGHGATSMLATRSAIAAAWKQFDPPFSLIQPVLTIKATLPDGQVYEGAITKK